MALRAARYRGITCSEVPTLLCHATASHASTHEHRRPRTRRDRRARHSYIYQHRLTSSRQAELRRPPCMSAAVIVQKAVSRRAVYRQDHYCNFCYSSSRVAHKTRALTVAIGARATVDGGPDQEPLYWRRWKLVRHPGRWPPADVDWGPSKMTLMPTGLGPMTEPSAAARLIGLPDQRHPTKPR